MTKNEAIQRALRLQAELRETRTALRVIRTWASNDAGHGERKALDPEDVVKLCAKALKEEE